MHGGSYSLDLRERVVAAVGSGMSRALRRSITVVGVATAIRWTARAKRTGSPAALPMGGKKPFRLAAQGDWIQPCWRPSRILPDANCWPNCASARSRSATTVCGISSIAPASAIKNTARQRARSP